MSEVQVRHSAPATEQVRYRLVPWQLAMPFTVIVLAACGQVFLWLTPSQPAGAAAPTAADSLHSDVIHAVLYAMGAVLVLIVLLGTRWFGITLTPTEVRVHNLRRRVIRWSDVRAVEAETSFGTWSIVLYEANRRTRLRAPITGILMWDRGFEAKYHAIEQWWLTHREPTDSPPWEG